LDINRRADLLKYVGKGEQVLFTTTDLSFFTPEFTSEAEIWDVSGGVVQPRK
jgi:recombinational DNA repair ATPase RecF